MMILMFEVLIIIISISFSSSIELRGIGNKVEPIIQDNSGVHDLDVVVLGSCYLYYGNLISNCGFENGLLSPWVGTPSFLARGVSQDWATSTVSPYLGNYCITTGANLVGDYFTTTIQTVPGANYVVSFNFRNVGTPNQVWLNFGTTRVLTLVDAYYPSWVLCYGVIQLTTSSTQVQFMGYNRPDYAYFDNIIIMETVDSLLPITCGVAPPATTINTTE